MRMNHFLPLSITSVASLSSIHACADQLRLSARARMLSLNALIPCLPPCSNDEHDEALRTHARRLGMVWKPAHEYAGSHGSEEQTMRVGEVGAKRKRGHDDDCASEVSVKRRALLHEAKGSAKPATTPSGSGGKSSTRKKKAKTGKATRALPQSAASIFQSLMGRPPV